MLANLFLAGRPVTNNIEGILVDLRWPSGHSSNIVQLFLICSGFLCVYAFNVLVVLFSFIFKTFFSVQHAFYSLLILLHFFQWLSTRVTCLHKTQEFPDYVESVDSDLLSVNIERIYVVRRLDSWLIINHFICTATCSS